MPADDRAGPGKAPDAFRTISEVAEDLDLPQHVLRFWETRFAQIKPMKRGGGRRYYRPEDVELLRGIRILLYAEGFTIRGVQRLLKEKGVAFVTGVARTGSSQAAPEVVARETADPLKTALASATLAESTAADDGADGEAEDVAESVVPQPVDTLAADARAPNMSPAPPPRPTAFAAAAQLGAGGRRKLERILDDLVEARRLLDSAR